MQSQKKIVPDERFDVATHFGFGDNWAEYAAHITPEKIQQAELGLSSLIGPEDIQGKTFLDIGCGSGLHTLAALKAGAGHVTAIDFDPASVRTAQQVIAANWPDQNVQIFRCNILDPESLKSLNAKGYDVVYSWGVLHHTGDMMTAIQNAAGFVAPGGVLALALYKKTPLCGAWRAEKKLYTRLPRWARAPMNWMYAGAYVTALAAQGQNPITYIRSYEQKRGMRFMNDVVDWLGGYPYESISPVEAQNKLSDLGFDLVLSLNTDPMRGHGLFGSGCAEYVFRKSR